MRLMTWLTPWRTKESFIVPRADPVIRLVTAAPADGTTAEPPKSDASTPIPAASPEAARAKAAHEGLERVRADLKTYAAVLGAVGTAILGGAGFTALTKLAPAPSRTVWIGAGIAAVIAVVAVAALVANFYAPTRRIVFNPSRVWPGDASCAPCADRIKQIVAAKPQVLEQTASSNHRDKEALVLCDALRGTLLAGGANSMHDLERKAVHESEPRPDESDPERDRRIAEAHRLYAAYDAVAAEAALAVLETRAAKAMSSWRLIGLPSLAGIAIAVLFGLAYYSEGERAAVDLQTKCAANPTLSSCIRILEGPPSATPNTALLTRLAACQSEAAKLPTKTGELVEKAVAACAQVQGGPQGSSSASASKPAPTTPASGSGTPGATVSTPPTFPGVGGFTIGTTPATGSPSG